MVRVVAKVELLNLCSHNSPNIYEWQRDYVKMELGLFLNVKTLERTPSN